MGRLAGRRTALLALALAALLAAGCAGPGVTGPHGVHVVRPGENLYRISRYYGVDTRRIVRTNRIHDVTGLAVGQRLVIPGARKPQPGHSLAPGPTVAARPPTTGGREIARREADLAFSWPLSGRVSSGFGWRRGQRHEGIDIPARKGTRIRAAEAGRVIHSGALGAYGRVVIVKHAGRYSTVYAHNEQNLVRKGQFVEKGQAVGTVGRSGRATGPHLHFELRRDRIAHDPLRYLPGTSLAARGD